MHHKRIGFVDGGCFIVVNDNSVNTGISPMQIILEGADNAGKSTLATYLSNALNIPLQHSGGPSRYPGEINARCFMFNTRDGTEVFDRHPAISQNIYTSAFNSGGTGERELVSEENVEAFYALKPLIIYCRNPAGLGGDTHLASEHSTQAHADAVAGNFDTVQSLYDAWAHHAAHIFYRVGDDMDRVVRMVEGELLRTRATMTVDNVFDPVADIEDFHRKFGIEYAGKPRLLPLDLFNFRSRFQHEENREYDDSHGNAHFELGAGDDEASFIHHLETAFDSLIDEVYVILGTAHLHGFDFREGWRRVHHANMQKVRAAADGSDSKRGSAFDVVKPKGWEPPKHTDLLEDHAHRDVFKPEKDTWDDTGEERAR